MDTSIVYTGWRKPSLSFSNGNCVEVGTFRTSSHSGSGSSSNCVEAGCCRHGVAVRDTKNPEGPMLRFRPQAWAAFLATVCRGIRCDW